MPTDEDNTGTLAAFKQALGAMKQASIEEINSSLLNSLAEVTRAELSWAREQLRSEEGDDRNGREGRAYQIG